MQTEPMLSVIVPFYNAERTLKRCLRSILEDRKGISLEIICVDDGSQDGSRRLVRRMMRRYRNIKLLIHEKNRGLFQARLTALRQARGSYIGFVDSDDYVRAGYFTELYRTAATNQYDVTVGRIVNQTGEGLCYLQTKCIDFPYTGTQEAENCYDMFWKQEGCCYPWHVVWNKLYRKKLWDVTFQELSHWELTLTMMEDFIFSSVVLSKAEYFGAAPNAYYYYVQSDTAATSRKAQPEKWRKNISDMGLAFDVVSEFLGKDSRLHNYQIHLENWKYRYSRYWTRNIKNAGFLEEETELLLELLKQKLKITELKLPDDEDEYYYDTAQFLPDWP